MAAQAGDILRGGAGAGTRPGKGGSGSPEANSANTAQVRANAQDALARAAQAVQSVQTMQKAARDMAIRGPNNLGMNPHKPGQRLPNVPNGLGVGGLQVAPGVPLDLKNPSASENAALWQGAKLPKQTVAGGKTTVTIKQTSQQAVLNWQTFNVGKETTLRFDQKGSDWVAFNKVNDPTGVPSQILGSIEAPGQVYILNQNGIIFGGSSQINLHTLVASSLAINDNLLTRGLLENPDYQFLFSSLEIPALTTGGKMPAFTPPAAPNTADGRIGDVIVQKGAVLTSPTSAEKVGGRIALVGPNVRNEGTISTPDGQTILAAGLQVGFTPHAGSDPSLRGLDVYIGKVVEPPSGDPPVAKPAYAGTATNAGLIDAPRANVTIAGKEVNQFGVIDGSTSVSLNGRIDLLASYNTVTAVVLNKPRFSPSATGTVTLGADSVTQILPELSSSETVTGTELALTSQINIQGRAIHLAADSRIFAPSAVVTLNAGTWLPLNGEFAFTLSKGQIYLDPGAVIDVSGSTDVSVPISQNILSLQLRGAELADSPVQRDGLLRGPTLSIDIRKYGIYNGETWVGTPLGNISGYVGLIERTVGEYTVAGGTVKMNAGGSVVMSPGSKVDVSGGWINFEGGLVQTTRVISGGQILDIAEATPDRVYDGIYEGKSTYTSAKWGVTETFTNPLALSGAHFEAGYTQGARGGSISIAAPSMALDGTLLGQTVRGEQQRASVPAASALSLAFQAQNPAEAAYPVYSPTAPNIIFQTGANQTPAAAFALNADGDPLALRADRIAEIILSPELLTTSGFGSLKIENSDGNITVPAGVTLSAPAGGSITLAGANITIDGNVNAPGGSLSFSSYNISPSVFAKLKITQGAQTPQANSGRGYFTLGEAASLSTAGLVLDDRPGSLAGTDQPIVIEGGTITIKSYSSNLASGSTVDVSGGALMSATGHLSYGNGGSIAIQAGQDINIASVLGGHLSLGSTVKGFSGTHGGSLTIQAPLIQIGGTTDNPNTFLISPEFFSQGGFGSFALTGLGTTGNASGEYLPGFVIAPGTVIAPIAQSWLAIPHASGGGLALSPTLLPEPTLRTPVSLNFGSVGVRDTFSNALIVRGDFKMGEGASIQTAARTNVIIHSDTAEVLGSIKTPGGTITISAGKDSTHLFADQTQALPTVYLGPNSNLSTAGTTILTPNAYGHRTGFVLPGGSISVSGNIVAATGSNLDVSGASGLLDIAPAYLGLAPKGVFAGLSLLPVDSGITAPLVSARVVSTNVASDGGSITLTGGQALYTNATLVGAAGGPTALGGNLIISSGRFYLPDSSTPPNPLDVTLEVAQRGSAFPGVEKLGIGKPFQSGSGDVLPGLGHFSVDQFNAGGFDSLALKGTVQFAGAVTINARRELTVADGGVIFADGAVRLSAPHVVLGTPFRPPVAPEQLENPFEVGGQAFNFLPTHGSGSLTVTADLIDVGNLSLQNIGRANFIADGGDIRGDGTLNVAGSIYLRAGQIYPPTAVSFTIAASDYKVGETSHSGSVTIAASGGRPLPLSAGGQLNVYGSIINQGGVLRAPLGSVNIGWDGTGTAPKDPITGQAFATTQKVTLGAGSITSVSALDPITGLPVVIPYGTNLNGVSWIDPKGLDITAGGVPGKTVTIAGIKVSDRPGSLIDMRGGGDLYAYRWVSGLGGSKDILTSSSSFAVIPSYGANYAPYAPYNLNPLTVGLNGDPGYLNGSLKVGDRIYLSASDGLPAGMYTLLPARYALLPGAFLVTPKDGAPIGNVSLADGSHLVSGYRFNDLNSVRTVPTLATRFEVAPGIVIRARSEFADYSANTFLLEGALRNEVPVPRLPSDAGHLVLQATQAMSLQGKALAQGAADGRGGLVDIASPSDILIGGSGQTGAAGTLVLDAAQLSRFGAESLLIGGVRTFTEKGVAVTVKTGNLTVDNAGTPLSAPDLVLVANKNLTVTANAVVVASGAASGVDTLLLGDAAVAGSGNGLLLRVSSDSSAEIVRAGVTSSNIPTMVVGANAQIGGAGLILDSTSATTLDPEAILNSRVISLNSGKISIQLADPGTLQDSAGLVLAGQVLHGLEAANSLSLLSYSSIDVYGTGQFTAGGNLALHAAEIRGFNNNGGTALFSAGNITLDNSPNGTRTGAVTPLNGTLGFDAGTIRIGSNQLHIDQFANLELNASAGIRVQGSGSLNTQGALKATAPSITASQAATQGIVASGALTLLSPENGSTGFVRGGLGASLILQGSTVTANSDILLPSGQLTLHATNGDVSIGGRLDAGGTAQSFFDLIRYTDGGSISLISDSGSVSVAEGGTVRVAASAAGGNAGGVSISTPTGGFTVAGKLLGQGGNGGRNGSFFLDVGTLPNVASLNALLSEASFTQAQNIRVRTGDVLVDGVANAHLYNLSADKGSITVSGTIDASGVHGGKITLQAGGGVTLLSGSRLTVAAQDFSNAGKGGAVSLETRGNAGAVVDIQTGSTIDLSVASNSATSAAFGNFTGTLHLRAPQIAGSTDLQVGTINGTILNASSISVEGFRTYDLTATGGAITSAVQNSVFENGTIFGGNSTAITSRLLANNTGLEPVLSVQTGAEIINRTGDLTLGTTNSSVASDWDLSSFRFGPKNAAGVLTLRAAGNLVFFNALSDGFTSSAYTAELMNQNTLLPANAQSWSYRLVAGADLTAADFHQVRPTSSLGANSGSLLLGKNAGNNSATSPGPDAQTATVIGNRYQVIRTGSGDIDIVTGRDVQLLNHFATIYTAGTKLVDASMGGAFDLPILDASGGQSALGAVQQSPGYAAQYSYAGGNVTIAAAGNIAHLTRNSAGVLIADSERQLPMNWLYRRGYVDPVTGEFGVARYGDVASTSWWIDFSNFFEGVGALGGGDVTMIAGHDISNVDGLVPTNARMPKGKPDANKLIELGGGDLTVRAGHDVDGGVYYVERGKGSLSAGNAIHTNSTRSPSLTNLKVPTDVAPPETWLPTTLFLGKGDFDIAARGDLLLGPLANPFLLPGGYNNTFWYKSYFSTYAPTNSVNVTSLAGAVTLRTGATLPTAGAGAAMPLLQAWMQKELLLTSNPQSASFYQPWLRLNETSVTPFATASALMPATLRATSFSSDINVVGDLTLLPSPRGTLDLAAAGSINGLQRNGVTFVNGVATNVWGSSTINLSDANPVAIPGVDSPFAYQVVAGIQTGAVRVTGIDFLKFVDALFAESGSTVGEYGVLQTKQALHAPGPLHAGDADPVHLYAQGGNISGLSLFSPKAVQVFAGRDITDIALYVQNVAESDVSVVASERDIVAFNANSPLRVAARAPGNALNFDSSTLAGDIQISGPGALEVLAGRNLDLGVGPNNPDGTALGITSIGNARNPYLPFDGADIIAGAGVGGPAALGSSRLDVVGFIEKILTPETLDRYLPELDSADYLTAATFKQLPADRQARVALDIFYRILREAGRSAGTASAAGTPDYQAGFDAIAALFPRGGWKGDISLTSREIKTQSGGDISLIAPGGKLTVGFDAGGNQPLDQGILTEAGGNISIFTDGDVVVGTSRIFTLRGGDEIIWSSNGDIAAGASSKTVQSAPPTRVVIDPQSGDVKTDLAGLATGGGIGVLATVAGVEPGDVDLIAPKGTVDAGDAGIRVSGNLNIAAVQVLNADNIQVAGTSVGAPAAPVVSAPNLGGLTAASNTTAATADAAQDATKQAKGQNGQQEELPSIISVEVLGYGGGDGSSEDDEKRRNGSVQTEDSAQR
ncbi:filamentous hemagglutinin family protein [Verrucomicrobiota bacterium sgz303538]